MSSRNEVCTDAECSCERYPEFIKELIYNLDAVPQHFVTRA